MEKMLLCGHSLEDRYFQNHSLSPTWFGVHSGEKVEGHVMLSS